LKQNLQVFTESTGIEKFLLDSNTNPRLHANAASDKNRFS